MDQRAPARPKDGRALIPAVKSPRQRRSISMLMTAGRMNYNLGLEMVHRRDTRHLGNPFGWLPPGGKLIIFGRPTLQWEGAPSPESYYRSLGFSDVHSLDVSPYEGATVIHDLNRDCIPEQLKGQYSAVLSGGTIEHVFNAGNAIKAGVDLLSVGGVFFCGGPCNNWIDHGFWQICPTAKFDFFAANNLEFRCSTGIMTNEARDIERVVPVMPGESNRLFNDTPGRFTHTVEAIKTAASTSDVVPLQSLYLKKHDGAFRGWRFRPFIPYDLIDDKKTEAPMRWFDLDVSTIKKTPHGFSVPFRVEGLHPSLPPGRPFRSRAILFEDDEIFSWVVSSLDLVADRARSFIHLGGHIHFSTSNGSDPRDNGRHYRLGFPQPFVKMQPYRP